MVSITLAAARHLQSLLEEAIRRAPEETPNDSSNEASLREQNFREDSTAQAGIKTLARAQRGLRVTVEKGGCAGLQYTMSLGDRLSDDVVIERDGVSVFIDPASAPYLSGAELDYCDDLVGTGFRLRNPNAVRSCGCGTSFEPALAASNGEQAGGMAQINSVNGGGE